MTIKEYIEQVDSENKDIEKIKEYNKQLIQKYPWIMPPDRWDPLLNHPEEIDSQYDYQWTMLDDLPDGWRIDFQDALCDEIQKEYEKLTDEQKKAFFIVQAKEKFGGMRLYMSFFVDSIEQIIYDYSMISEKVCIVCGKPATKISTGWICPYCDEHATNKYENYKDIKEYFKGENENE